MTQPSLPLFEEHRQFLFGIAYRMLGTVMDAQDMVQETYLRWQQVAPEEIRSPRAWLTTVVTRLCINHLRLARVQRETYVGPWLPEPLIDEQAPDPAASSQLADTLSLALLVLLETLTPAERAVFILREAFGCEFSEIAAVVEKTEDNCRQILTRARKHLDERRPRFDASAADAEKLLRPLIEAVRKGDMSGLLAVMAKDAVLVPDGGGKAHPLVRPVHGAEQIARLMINRRKAAAEDEETRCVTVNGLPGFVSFVAGRPRRVVALGFKEGLVHALYVISNPDKLRHLRGLD